MCWSSREESSEHTQKIRPQHKGQKLSENEGISRAGRLTEQRIGTLQNYFGCAIRQNSGDWQTMQQVHLASLLVSTTWLVQIDLLVASTDGSLLCIRMCDIILLQHTAKNCSHTLNYAS